MRRCVYTNVTRSRQPRGPSIAPPALTDSKWNRASEQLLLLHATTRDVVAKLCGYCANAPEAIPSIANVHTLGSNLRPDHRVSSCQKAQARSHDHTHAPPTPESSACQGHGPCAVLAAPSCLS